jgi:cytochrome c-type biogenesis protein CcmE
MLTTEMMKPMQLAKVRTLPAISRGALCAVKVENCGAVADVYFAGVVPDTFKEGAEVVIKGKFEGSTFQSNEVMAKCPSKYAQAGEQQSAMITRCSRESAQKGQ